ncbi:hypothetical protein ACFSKM_27825 [Ancylobacter dichloromethanicus]
MTDVELDLGLMEGLEVAIGTRRRPIDSVWISVAVFAECHGYLEKNGNRWSWVYFGDPANILVAEYVHEVVRRAARTAAREFRDSDVYRRRRTARTKAQALRALEEGFAAGIAPKIMAGLWKRKGVAGHAPAVRQALVQSIRAPIKEEMGRRGMSFKPSRALAPAAGKFRDAARWDGFAAGRAVDIDAPLAGRGVAGLLTSGDRS